jgi:hypothetical protein
VGTARRGPRPPGVARRRFKYPGVLACPTLRFALTSAVAAASPRANRTRVIVLAGARTTVVLRSIHGACNGLVLAREGAIIRAVSKVQ